MELIIKKYLFQLKEQVHFYNKFIVFDVSDAKFYGPGDSYHVFAGNDATVNLSKTDLNPKYLNQFDITSKI
jgi:Zn/Cd-binding protein ZinT